MAPELYEQTLLETLRETPGREGRESLWRRLFAGALFLLRGLVGRKGRSGRRGRGDRARDELEEPLLAEMLAAGRPVLGICRGAQLINVHLGGTLHQDLSDFYEEVPDSATLRPRKLVEIAPGSLLEDILDAESCHVNALHRQAVDRQGEGLEVVARESNGVAQAVEAPGRDFLLGVQWHPEYLPWIRRQQRIFRRLVEASRR